MKCIKCSTDNNLKDRKNSRGHCKKCRHEFAFDPKLMSGVNFTDKFFQSMLQKLSANNSLFFTSRQLYCFFNERYYSKKADFLKMGPGCAIAAAMIFVIFMIANGFGWLAFLMFLLVIPFSVALLISPNLRKKLRGTRPIPLSATPQQVDVWYRRWCRINGDVPNLLPPLSSARSITEATKISPELKQYSFDRAVICDSPEIARCLIANNFHFENNSAVLSIDGYPHGIFDTVMDMLRRNPRLHVYALHDASKRGIALPHTLRTHARWFADSNVKIFDLGLLPRQILDRSVFVEKELPVANQSIPPQIFAGLRPEEINWLAGGNFVSLESFPPQTLLRVVTRGIAKSRDPQFDDALVPIVWADGDAGIYYYGAESFG